MPTPAAFNHRSAGRALVLAALAWTALGAHAQAQENAPPPKMPEAEPERQMGVPGPLTADLAEGEITLPEGYVFFNKSETQKIRASQGDRVAGNERGAVVSGKGEDWVVYFSFDNIGYVKDDEKDNINADAILDSYKESAEARNKERPNQPPLSIVGWREKPHYDTASHNLEWCIEAKVGDAPLVNHKIKILGRRGVMDVTLACDPQNLDPSLAEVRQLLGGYTYKTGSKYEEWTTGDKVAAYGLTALVAGGAVAAAAKTGLLAKLAKPILAGLAILAGAVAKGWNKLTSLFSKRGE